MTYGSAAFAFISQKDGDSDADEDGGRDQYLGDGEELVGLVFSGDDGEDAGEGGGEESNGGEGDGDGAALQSTYMGW